MIEEILLTCTIFQGLAFLSKSVQSGLWGVAWRASKLIKGALPVTYHTRTRSTQSVCIKLVVPWRCLSAVDLGTYPVEEVCCQAAFTDIRSHYTHAVTYTRGRGVFLGECWVFMCPLLHWHHYKRKGKAGEFRHQSQEGRQDNIQVDNLVGLTTLIEQ